MLLECHQYYMCTYKTDNQVVKLFYMWIKGSGIRTVDNDLASLNLMLGHTFFIIHLA